MKAATEGSLPLVMPQGNLVEVLGREVRQGSPGELMVESTPSRQRRPPCKTNKEMSDEAADAAALTYLLCGECDTVSSAASTGANRCARFAQVAACPWPEPPAGPRRRTEEEALHRRIEGAQAPSHKRAGPAGAALLWIHVYLWDPNSVAHLSHVFAP